jgi:hypothetical protein
VEPTTVNAILSGRDGTGLEAWYRASVYAREAFWHGVQQVLARLANRIGAEEAAKIIAAINVRIPMLTAEETTALPRWEDQALLNRWKRAEQEFVDLIKREEKSIRDYEKLIADARETIRVYRPAGEEVSQGVKAVQRAIVRGDRKAIKQLTEDGREVGIAILKILAGRIPRPPRCR